MKRGTPHHKKMRMLAKILKVELHSAVGMMEMLWHFTAQHSPQGDIGLATDKEIANAVGWKKKPALLIDALVECAWIERDTEHRLLIHDWEQHCDDAVKMLLKRKNKPFFVATMSRQCGDNVPPSREARAEAGAVRVGEEGVGEGEPAAPSVALVPYSDPLQILEELKAIYHRAGVPVPEKHEQVAVQLLVGIPPDKRHRVPDYVKHMLLSGRWKSAEKTKGLLNLLRDGDWDVPIVARTLPPPPSAALPETPAQQRARILQERRAARGGV